MNEVLLSKRKIFGLLLFVLICGVIWFIFSYSLLTINSVSSENKQVSLFNSKNEEVDSFVLGKNTELLLLKRDSYVLRVSGDDMFSTYKKSLAPLWLNQLSIELKPQKKSVYLGKSFQPCIKEKGDEILFASCSPYKMGNFIESSTRGTLTADPSTEPNQTNLSFGALKDYKDGFLYASSGQNRLTLLERDTNNNQPLVVSGFRGNTDNQSLFTDKYSNNFVVYDNKAKKLFIFNNTTDQNPLRVALPEDKIDPDLNTTMAITKDYLYFISSDGEPHSHSDEDAKPRILAYSTKTGQLKEDYTIPKEWLIKRVETNRNGQILLTVTDLKTTTRKLYFIDGIDQPAEITSISSPAQDACWKDNNNFYYLADSGESIYMYSITTKASYLVYGGLNTDSISSIQCSDKGDLYFSFDLTSERKRAANKEKGYYHFKIINKDFSGIRIEGLVPLYVNVNGIGGSVLELTQGQNNVVNVSPVFFSGSEKNIPSHEDALKAIRDKLNNEGINTRDMDLKLNF